MSFPAADSLGDGDRDGDVFSGECNCDMALYTVLATIVRLAIDRSSLNAAPAGTDRGRRLRTRTLLV